MKKKIYNVKKIPDKNFKIEGNTITTQLSTLNTVSNFVSPWDNNPIQPIIFKACYDNSFFYFSFQVNDNDVYTQLADDTRESINQSDRVELFFRINDSLTPYYCLEIDSKARIMDFKALPNRKFDFNWSWDKSEIEVKSYHALDRFIVEGKLSIKSLKDLNILKKDNFGAYMEVGLYRAKYMLNKQKVREPIWITWVDPNFPTPEFHTPNSFGLFRFLD
ncbi:carbohydrate-binding family 9-like protein [Formosa algae]|uniref:carbohydrate-binding family 9-like protein n=1 Tax=Formosa algae TaxID=225843 RepID=UPI0011AF5431|nr:carbohydrate-binding family 9-like protein [Formosa algae]